MRPLHGVGNSCANPPDSKRMKLWMGGRKKHIGAILARYQCSRGNEAVCTNKGLPQ